MCTKFRLGTLGSTCFYNIPIYLVQVKQNNFENTENISFIVIIYIYIYIYIHTQRLNLKNKLFEKMSFDV